MAEKSTVRLQGHDGPATGTEGCLLRAILNICPSHWTLSQTFVCVRPAEHSIVYQVGSGIVGRAASGYAERLARGPVAMRMAVSFSRPLRCASGLGNGSHRGGLVGGVSAGPV